MTNTLRANYNKTLNGTTRFSYEVISEQTTNRSVSINAA